MDSSFITISEASEKTGRSLSTIRRLIKTITETDGHPDRDAIQPTPKEVAAFKKKGENFTWRIQEAVIMKHFAEAPLKEKKKAEENTGSDIMSILQKELELKNQQIEKQWEVIHALNDRLREGNILMGSLQKRLALPHPESSDAVLDASSTKDTLEASANTNGGSRRRGLFGWRKK